MSSVRSMADRFAGLFGYQRVALGGSATPISAMPEVAGTPAHLAREADFDYDHAPCDRDWAFTLSSLTSLGWSIGQRGWMPVALAGLMLGEARADGQQLISEAINSRMWLRPESPAHASWLAANEEAFERVSMLREGLDHEGRMPAAPFDARTFAGLPAAIVSHELRTMWRRARPKQTLTLLSHSAAHAELIKLPVMAQPGATAQGAMDQLIEWTAAWLEARGLTVRREHMLVAVDGYEPLIYIDDEPGSY